MTVEQAIEDAVRKVFKEELAQLPMMAKPTPCHDKPTMTAKQAAHALGVSPAVIYNWLRIQDCPFLLQVGARKLILTQKFFNWVEETGGRV